MWCIVSLGIYCLQCYFCIHLCLQYWSDYLAKTAKLHACQCNYDEHSSFHHSYKESSSVAVENQGLSTSHEVVDIIDYWFREGESYNYHGKACYPDHYNSYTCEHYIRVSLKMHNCTVSMCIMVIAPKLLILQSCLTDFSPLQMVWARACEVGCAITECSGLQEDYNRYYRNYYNHNDPHEGSVFLLVCVYGGAYPDSVEDLLYSHHPYRAGPPCRDCPRRYPLCDPNPFFIHGDTAIASQDLPVQFGGIGGLCCKH